MHIDNFLGSWPEWQRDVAAEDGALDLPPLADVLCEGEPEWVCNEIAGTTIEYVDRNIAYMRELFRMR